MRLYGGVVRHVASIGVRMYSRSHRTDGAIWYVDGPVHVALQASMYVTLYVCISCKITHHRGTLTHRRGYDLLRAYQHKECPRILCWQ